MFIDQEVSSAVGYKIESVGPFAIQVVAPEPGQYIVDLSINMLRALVREHHLVVVRGFANFQSAEALTHYCAKWGTVSKWPFGTVLELIEQENPADHIFDSNYVPLHWDGMYRSHIPEFQIFQCVSAPGKNQGGRTTFSNTVAVLASATRQQRALWGKITGSYHRKMAFYESKVTSPIITPHPVAGFPVIRYNEPTPENDETFINRPTLEFTGISDKEIATFHCDLREAFYAPEHFYAHAWREGDLVIADNYTLLHGREAFTSGAPRHLRRVHVLGDPPFANPGLVEHVEPKLNQLEGS